MNDVEAAEAAVIQAVQMFAHDLLAGSETHTGQIENQVAALIAAVRRDERAQMPCYDCGLDDVCLPECGCGEEARCLTCAARAERDGGTG